MVSPRFKGKHPKHLRFSWKKNVGKPPSKSCTVRCPLVPTRLLRRKEQERTQNSKHSGEGGRNLVTKEEEVEIRQHIIFSAESTFTREKDKTSRSNDDQEISHQHPHPLPPPPPPHCCRPTPDTRIRAVEGPIYRYAVRQRACSSATVAAAVDRLHRRTNPSASFACFFFSLALVFSALPALSRRDSLLLCGARRSRRTPLRPS